MNIHENIKKYRKLNKLTLEQLAKSVGVSKQTIARYETGEIKNIPYDKIIAIAEKFRITPGELMGFEDVEESIIIDHNLAATDIELIEIFNSLSDKNKDIIINTINALLLTEKKE